jgi:glycosyltransferase involved in cell wall biosynthesis
VSAGYNIFSKNKHKLYFDSIERQNYSNYHILYVDDNSPDQSAYRILDYLNSTTNSKIKGRITIIRTLQNLGGMANFLLWAEKYCVQDSIVANPDPDDILAGTQSLQILNAAYKNPDVWVAYSRYVSFDPVKKSYETGVSK